MLREGGRWIAAWVHDIQQPSSWRGDNRLRTIRRGRPVYLVCVAVGCTIVGVAAARAAWAAAVVAAVWTAAAAVLARLGR